MSARLLLIVALGALLLTPLAGAAAPNPAKLVLRQGDVPAAYRLNREKSGPRTVARDAREFPELRQKYAAWGHLAAFQNEFDRGNDQISSRVDIFRSRRGAGSMLAWFVREANRQSQLHIRPTALRLGDEGMLYAWMFQRDAFTIALWRTGRAFALVSGAGIPKRAVVALARTQHRRIVAALG